MNIVEKYCTGNNRYKAAQRYTPVGVVLHSIGTPQPKASVLWNYWQNNGSQYVVHYMVDDTQILHCMPDNYKCWHVGSPGNAKYIGIEMGEPRQIHYTSGSRFTVSDLVTAQRYTENCYKNAVELIAYLCKKYGWNPDTDVHTHYEITQRRLSNTDHVDPQHLWNGLGMGYDLATLKRDVKAAMRGLSEYLADQRDIRSRFLRYKQIVGDPDEHQWYEPTKYKRLQDYFLTQEWDAVTANLERTPLHSSDAAEFQRVLRHHRFQPEVDLRPERPDPGKEIQRRRVQVPDQQRAPESLTYNLEAKRFPHFFGKAKRVLIRKVLVAK